MKKELILKKVYDPKPVEEKWSQFWINEGLFKAERCSTKEKYSMVLPPPNVTGSLHMGHALCFTLPDIIVRWRKMQGYNTLWLPGTDHASIAVHNVIEQNLLKKGLTRDKIGREEFLKLAWDWKTKYGSVITHQLKKLGLSLDWSRERFTMDEGFSKAVKHVFVELHKEGLIYRDYYLVNRCPNCGTVLSDIEIEHKELKSSLYYISYPIIDSKESIVVATTRPETMLGDTAVAVHPEDDRYAEFHGKRVLLPLVNRAIPIIVDERVDKEFGTGVVKVTPAHDAVDFDLGKNHGLEQIIVIDGSGRMTGKAGEEFKGLDRFEAREKILSRLKEDGFLVKTEDYRHSVGHCYRCKNIIEPYLSWQWFVRVAPLAREAIKVVKEGRVQFIPSNWTKTYFEWMYNIHDWCISRQLWWGHRIPAWYCQQCHHMMVVEDTPQKCEKCGSEKLAQDKDVLDTWFSSALWPFATMGWPEETEDLKKFYPTDLMATGFDIIFFWVARMIMMGVKFMGDIPFRHVFINGLVRDFKRRKMSKSEGNIIDPLEMIDKYGTDALRFTLASLAIPGMDISLSEERMAGYRAFVNKIWNASRFVLMNLNECKLEIKEEELTLADRWVRSRMALIIGELNEALENYRFYDAADKIYHFIWHEFCDWYVEFVKPSLKEQNRTSQTVLVETLGDILKLLHPFMPFVTEEIWQHLPFSRKSLTVMPYPCVKEELRNEEVERVMAFLQDMIVEVRTIRAENRIPPRKKIILWVKTKRENELKMINLYHSFIKTLANVREIKIQEEFPSDVKLLKGVVSSLELAIPVEEGLINFNQERQRLEREIEKVNLEIKKIEGRLTNGDFLDKAPKELVNKTRQRLNELDIKRTKLRENLRRVLSFID